MFPAGAAGSGLLILRLCAAGMLLRDVMPRATAAPPYWGAAGVILLAAIVIAGALTPVSSIASGVVQIATCTYAIQPPLVDVALSLGVTLALCLTGPGAFSIDGRLFGRRLIHPSSRQIRTD
jgi:hypothetical protein